MSKPRPPIVTIDLNALITETAAQLDRRGVPVAREPRPARTRTGRRGGAR